MKKIDFLKFAKISCFVLGLSSLALTSCKIDDPDDPEVDPLNDAKFPVLESDGFSVTYPIGHSFKAWDQNNKVVSIDKQKYTFSNFVTMDTLSKNVRISYLALIDPTTAQPSVVDGLTKVFKNDVYCEDNGHQLLSEETVTLSGYDARKLTAMNTWAIDPQTMDTVYFSVYKERYIFFDSNTKKVYSIEMEMPDSLKASRRAELYGILSSVKIKN